MQRGPSVTGHKPLSEKKEVIDLSVSYGKDRKSLVPELKQRWDDIRHHRETCPRRTVERTFESCPKDNWKRLLMEFMVPPS